MKWLGAMAVAWLIGSTIFVVVSWFTVSEKYVCASSPARSVEEVDGTFGLVWSCKYICDELTDEDPYWQEEIRRNCWANLYDKYYR